MSEEIKRFIIERAVAGAEGSQCFFVDAKSEQEALTLYEAKGGEIYDSECEITELGEPNIIGETDLDDFGDSKQTGHQSAITKLEEKIAGLEAKVDALMLEYCPLEMPAEQRTKWAKHQIANEATK